MKYIYIYTFDIHDTPFPKSDIYVGSKINPRFIAYVVRNSAWPWWRRLFGEDWGCWAFNWCFFPTNPSQIEWDLTNGPLSVSCDGAFWILRFRGSVQWVRPLEISWIQVEGGWKGGWILFGKRSWKIFTPFEPKVMGHGVWMEDDVLRISMGWFLGSMLFLFYSFSHNHENGKQLHLKGNDSIGALPWLREEG